MMQLPSLFEERMRFLLGAQYNEFLAGYDLPLRRGLRVNTQRISAEEFCRLFPHPLEESPFAPDCFYLDASHKAGSDPLHHAGAYYMQEPSAASAVTVLDPKSGECILDLCAAPGGKSTQIATALGDTGLLWSNEYVPARARILQQNLERWGVRNQVVSNRDTGTLCEALADCFDAVLVDAPCSGEGMFRKEPQALTEWSMDNIALCAARQDEILDNAAKTVRPNGRLVYSTCTFAPQENEETVSAFLARHPEFREAAVAAPHFTKVTPGFRLWPHKLKGEGHYVAVLEKMAGDEASPNLEKEKPLPKVWQDFGRDLGIILPEGKAVSFGNTWF